MPSASRALRAAFERLPDGTREQIKRRRASLVGLGQLKRNQALLVAHIARLEQAAGTDQDSSTGSVDDRFPATVRSRVCTQSQFGEPWYTQWCSALGERPRANRKLWEHAYIAHSLDALGKLGVGRRGLAFGVGREPLVALFAGLGCEVVATDAPGGSEAARSWNNNSQYGGDLEGLLRPSLCDPADFEARVTWRPVDMRSVPDDLTGFDFCWSACSLEHLGSLEAGLEFLGRSLDTLAPGGIAVHTTEYNATSNDATIASGHTVLYREKDLSEAVARLEAAGHQVAALDLEAGQGVLDEYVDVPPYAEEPHVRLRYKRFTTTSVALVIKARMASANR